MLATGVVVGSSGVVVAYEKEEGVGNTGVAAPQAVIKRQMHPARQIQEQMDTDLGNNRRVSICFLGILLITKKERLFVLADLGVAFLAHGKRERYFTTGSALADDGFDFVGDSRVLA